MTIAPGDRVRVITRAGTVRYGEVLVVETSYVLLAFAAEAGAWNTCMREWFSRGLVEPAAIIVKAPT